MGKKKIYEEQARLYQQLIGYEDFENRLAETLTSITDFSDTMVVEMGAGTGRLSRILAEAGARVDAYELNEGMLDEARRITDSVLPITYRTGDNRELPCPDNYADISAEGWSFIQMAVWFEGREKEMMMKALGEMERCTKPGGLMVCIETLGTLHSEPVEAERFRDLYQCFYDWGMTREWCRTDYQFPSLDEAVELIGFFFGKKAAETVRNNGWSRVPECTGIWYKRKA